MECSKCGGALLVFQTTEEDKHIEDMRYRLVCPICFPHPDRLWIVSDPDLRLRWECILHQREVQ